MFKRSPSLTEQTKTYIKERILDGEFEEGRIPSENELAGDLGVSRTTIRGALSRLEIEGAIYRKQGAGTFVNRAGLQIKSRLEEIWSYESVLEAHGYTPVVQVLAAREIPASPELASELHLDPIESVLVISKLFKENDDPVILTRNYIPKRFITQPYDLETCRLPIYDFLETCCQQQLTYYLSEVVPLAADKEIAAKLEIPQGAALISFEEIGYDADNQPLLTAQSYFRDDLLRFRLIRRRS